MDADGRIEVMDGSAIFCTKSLADALAWDAKQTYNTIMPWQVLFDGLKVSEWDGVKVYSISLFDRFTKKKYQDNDTKLNLPHRAVYTSPPVSCSWAIRVVLLFQNLMCGSNVKNV